MFKQGDKVTGEYFGHTFKGMVESVRYSDWFRAWEIFIKFETPMKAPFTGDVYKHIVMRVDDNGKGYYGQMRHDVTQPAEPGSPEYNAAMFFLVQAAYGFR